ncbi:hypothetical protein LTR56_013964 [Elasticomyces elasticus]|nr:hypothetical protein LTR56_013964 [Elasticomyces elasticus]KAK3656710.1 hypothetical protein LTR22_009689 [Elasticomyces elasticus]KAK4921582.1 hypothetical protein LTR49_011052 [Elasticomyces elasticus]KAK5760270.1 hypothetical protein LTS12_009654 [Elasticomyces elasticus]
MSFMKKLTKGFEELKSTFSDEPKKDQTSAHQAPLQEQRELNQPPHGQQAYGQAQSYGQPQGYQPPPPPQQHGGPPPSLPPGWTVQWDQASQRNFYIETATGRTQWDSPAQAQSHYPPPPPQGAGGYPAPPGGPSYGQDANRGVGGNYGSQQQYNSGYQGAPGYNPHSQAGPYDPNMGGHAYGQPPKKDNSTRNMMLAGAGGLAGGALLANAFDDDDNHNGASQSQNYGGQQGYGAPPQQQGYVDADNPPPANAPLPTRDEDGDVVDSSDRESVQEAQDDVRDAQEEVNEASSESDREEAQEDLQEAQEEYHEEYEETYDD